MATITRWDNVLSGWYGETTRNAVETGILNLATALNTTVSGAFNFNEGEVNSTAQLTALSDIRQVLGKCIGDLTKLLNKYNAYKGN